MGSKDGLKGFIGKPMPHTQTTLGVLLLNKFHSSKKKVKVARRYRLNHRRNSFTFARRRKLVNRLRNTYHLPIQHIAMITGYSLRTIHQDIISIGNEAFHCAKRGFIRSKKRLGKIAIRNVLGIVISLKTLCRLAFYYLNGDLVTVEEACGEVPP